MQALHTTTPIWESRSLSEAMETPVLLKMEVFQPVGSFKARGMGATCMVVYESGVPRVVCSSGGNAGYAVAYAGKQLDVDVTIVVPVTTSPTAKELIAQEGAPRPPTRSPK